MTRWVGGLWERDLVCAEIILWCLRQVGNGNTNTSTSLGEAHSCWGRQILDVYAKTSYETYRRHNMGRDSSVGIATGYGLDGPGIEYRWGRDFPHPSRPSLRPTQPSMQWVPGLCRGGKRPRRGVDHPPPSSAEVKQRVELYLYSPSGLSWPVLRWTLPLPLPKLRRRVLPPSSGYISPTFDS